MTNPLGRVAIVGGGLAGMATAVALRRTDANLDITLFEAKRVTGGRAGSFTDAASGQPVDYCQHVAMGCCAHLIEMLTYCGLHDPFVRSSELWFHHPQHAPSRFAAARFLPAPLHLLPTLFRLRYLSTAQRLQISRATWALMRTPPESLRGVTAGRWLEMQGQSAETIRDYWEVVIASALGETTHHVSMAAARKVFVDGFLATRGASDVLVPRLPLAELFGRRLPEAIAAMGIRIRTGTAVQKVSRDPTTSQPMLETNDRIESYAQIVLAVPWRSLSKIIDRQLADAAKIDLDRLSAIPASPITGIHLWFDSPITDLPHAVLVGTRAQWLFRRAVKNENIADHAANARSLEPEGHYYQVVISASHFVKGDQCELAGDELVNQVQAELRSIFPAAATAKLLRSRVVTDPHSVFSLRPEVDAVRPTASTALPWLHLAGDWIQTRWPATMEGAVISGHLAAASVLGKHASGPGSWPTASLDHPPVKRLSRWLIRS